MKALPLGPRRTDALVFRHHGVAGHQQPFSCFPQQKLFRVHQVLPVAHERREVDGQGYHPRGVEDASHGQDDEVVVLVLPCEALLGRQVDDQAVYGEEDYEYCVGKGRHQGISRVHPLLGQQPVLVEELVVQDQRVEVGEEDPCERGREDEKLREGRENHRLVAVRHVYFHHVSREKEPLRVETQQEENVEVERYEHVAQAHPRDNKVRL